MKAKTAARLTFTRAFSLSLYLLRSKCHTNLVESKSTINQHIIPEMFHLEQIRSWKHLRIDMIQPAKVVPRFVMQKTWIITFTIHAKTCQTYCVCRHLPMANRSPRTERTHAKLHKRLHCWWEVAPFFLHNWVPCSVFHKPEQNVIISTILEN